MLSLCALRGVAGVGVIIAPKSELPKLGLLGGELFSSLNTRCILCNLTSGGGAFPVGFVLSVRIRRLLFFTLGFPLPCRFSYSSSSSSLDCCLLRV